MRRHVLAFLEDSKSRDSWQCGAAAYYAVQGGSNFWGFLNEIIQTKAVRFVPDSYMVMIIMLCKVILSLNISYQKCDHSSEK